MKRRYLDLFMLFGAILLLMVAAFGFGRFTLSQGAEAEIKESESTEDSLFWDVKEQTIGRSIAYSATVSSSVVDGPLVNREGVVTAGPRSQGALEEGDIVLEVNLDPVLVGRGTVPAFRDLTEGDNGEDVQQLRDFLCRRGFAVCAENETFTPAMTQAVKDWQKSVGKQESGSVLLGDIMWFSEVPVDVRISGDFRVGSSVVASDRPISVASGEPSAVIKVSEDQITLIPEGSVFTMEGDLSGVVGSYSASHSDDEGVVGFTAPLLSADGSESFCTKQRICYELLSGQNSVTVNLTIQTVPVQTGLGVPTGAVRSSADGETYVTMHDGTRKPVTVVARSGGISLIEGLQQGDRILLTDVTERSSSSD